MLWTDDPTALCRFQNFRSLRLEVSALQEADSLLAKRNQSFKNFLSLLFSLSFKSLFNVDVSAIVGLIKKAVEDWRMMLSNAVADWLTRNSTRLGGPGKVVEVDEAKFGKLYS